MDSLANFVEYYLPVFIPVFLTVISVLAGIVTNRIKLELGHLLKIHSDVVLGLFSFVIWALVAYQQTGRIDLNADASISLIRVVLLLFGNIILLIAGLIILRYRWEPYGADAQQSAKENWANGIFLLIAFVGVLAPIGLAKDRPQVIEPPQRPQTAQYQVAIPYADSSIPSQVGAARWNDRTLCATASVTAESTAQAIAMTLQSLEDSKRFEPVFSNPRRAHVVTVLQDRIVAAVRP